MTWDWMREAAEGRALHSNPQCGAFEPELHTAAACDPRTDLGSRLLRLACLTANRVS